MKNNKGFTLIELLAVIVVLAIVMVLATTTVLPYMSTAREDAFRIEATNVVKSAESAKDLYSIGQVKVGTGNTAADSCVQGTTMCFTVEDLIKLGLYEGDSSSYKGKVVITNYNGTTPTYTLSLAKGTEFYITGTTKDYTNKTVNLSASLANGYDVCTCS